MPRFLTVDFNNAIEQAVKVVAIFVTIEFANETLYIWSGATSFTPGRPHGDGSAFPYGQTFTGVGWLGSISAIPETVDVVAQNVTLTLSGIPPELVSDTINAVRQYSEATVWFGLFDTNGNLIADPVQMFQGHLDVPTIMDGAADATISITAENPLISLNLAQERRFTDCDQQLDYPGDLGMSFVVGLQFAYIQWPNPL